MPLLDPAVAGQQEEESNRNKVMRATVLEDNDPSKKDRIRIRVGELHRGVADGGTPWAVDLMVPQTSGGGMGGRRHFPKGSQVYVISLDEDGNNWGILGGVSSVTPINDLIDDYPNTTGTVDAGGMLTLRNTNKDTTALIHPTGAGFRMDGAGSVTLWAGSTGPVAPNADTSMAKGLTIHVIGNADVRVSQNADIAAAGIVNMSGSMVRMNSSPGRSAVANARRTRPNIAPASYQNKETQSE